MNKEIKDMHIAVVIGKDFFPMIYHTGHALYHAIYSSLAEIGSNVTYLETLLNVDDNFDLAIVLPQSFALSTVSQLKKKLKKCLLIACPFDPLPLGSQANYINHPYVKGFWKTFEQYLPFFNGILEIGQGGVQFLKSHEYNVVHFQLGYHPYFEQQQIKKDIDVSFLGDISRARMRILQRLRHRGYKHLFDNSNKANFRGFVMDTARSKITLNLRAKKDYAFVSVVRPVLFAMANKALVLSQGSLDMQFYSDKGLLVICNDHREFTEKINYYLSHEEERQQVTEKAYAYITKHSFQVGLERALQEITNNIEVKK